MENLIELILFGATVVIGFFAGSHIEKKHYESISSREFATREVPVVTAKSWIDTTREIEKAQFVHGNVVISTDYFKVLLAGLRSIFGGHLSAYETLVDRARREAILRLKDMAQGADIILNLRLTTSSISNTGPGTIEVYAYATAVYYKK